MPIPRQPRFLVPGGLLLGLCVGCGGGGSSTPVRNPPAIGGFTIAHPEMGAGESTTLSWTVTDADQISIAPGIGTVTGTSCSVTPTAGTTTAPIVYTLTASNPGGTVTRTVTTTVHPIHRQGQFTIRGTWLGDLHGGQEVGLPQMAEADVLWEQETDIVRHWTPYNGATFAVAGTADFTGLRYGTVAGMPQTSGKINGSDNAQNLIPTGTVLGGRTNAGRCCKVRIEQYGYNLSISFVTWVP